jgi:proteic killer suppression protein
MEFADRGTEDIYNGIDSKTARATLPSNLHKLARRKLDALTFAASIMDLRFPPGNNLEALKDDRKGQHSIRLNEKYRICFTWRDGRAQDVEIVDYH